MLPGPSISQRRHLALSSLLVCALAGAGLGACGGETKPPPAPRLTCAPLETTIQFPTPYWERMTPEGPRLAAPPGDALARITTEERPFWIGALGEIDGVAARPTFFIALDGPASSVEEGRAVLIAGGATPSALAVPLEARLDDEATSTLIVRPRDPLPEIDAATPLVLALRPGVAAGASPIPSCPPKGSTRSPAYDAALAVARGVVPDAELALFVRRARLPEVHRAIEAALRDAPPLKVTEASTTSLAGLGVCAPDPETTALLEDPTPRGILETPLYLDATQRLHADPATGLPLATGTTKPGFMVALPKGFTPPFPWVLFQHGGGGDKCQIFRVAKPFVKNGIALVGVDLLYHGDRAEGGHKGTGAEYIDFGDPLRMRDMLRQTSADHLSVLGGINALNGALAKLTGAAVTLDPDRIFYLGHSLGALSGGLTAGVSTRIRAAALFNGGGGWEDIAKSGTFSIIGLATLRNRSPLEQDAALHIAETLLDGGDPLAYAARFDGSTPTLSVAILEAASEQVFDNATTDKLARAWGAALARPMDHTVDGVAERDLPFSGNFASSGGAVTRALVQNKMTGVAPSSRHGAQITDPHALDLVGHCFGTLLGAGRCEIIDTGFGL